MGFSASRLHFPSRVALGRGNDEPVGVCNLDEDAATLAVEAAHQLLRQGRIDASGIGRVELVGASPEVASTVALALGVGTQGGSTIRIRVHAPRAGSPDAVSGRPAHAAAALDASPPEGTGPLRPQVLLGTADQFQRLVKAEQDALGAVPMGAYVPRRTWDATLATRYRLLSSVCDTCRAGHHPPLPVCPVCHNATRTVSLWKPGRLYTWTHVASGPSEFDPWHQVWGEYTVAVVEHEHGIRLAGILVDADPARLREGMAVEPVFRRLYAQEGAWRYGVKFRPSEP